jgi:hypothetical protein
VKTFNETGLDLTAGPGIAKTVSVRFVVPADEMKLVLVWWDMECPAARSALRSVVR